MDSQEHAWEQAARTDAEYWSDWDTTHVFVPEPERDRWCPHCYELVTSSQRFRTVEEYGEERFHYQCVLDWMKSVAEDFDEYTLHDHTNDKLLSDHCTTVSNFWALERFLPDYQEHMAWMDSNYWGTYEYEEEASTEVVEGTDGVEENAGEGLMDAADGGLREETVAEKASTPDGRRTSKVQFEVVVAEVESE